MILRARRITGKSTIRPSTATAFALCAGATEAESLAEKLQLWRPDWWVAHCRLGGPWTE